MRGNLKPEELLHRAVADWLTLAFPEDSGVFWTSIENKPRSAVSGGMNKQRGVKSGVPDILIVYRGRPIFIELKAEKGVVQPHQKAVMDAITNAGGFACVRRSLPSVVDTLTDMGLPIRARVAA